MQATWRSCEDRTVKACAGRKRDELLVELALLVYGDVVDWDTGVLGVSTVTYDSGVGVFFH